MKNRLSQTFPRLARLYRRIFLRNIILKLAEGTYVTRKWTQNVTAVLAKDGRVHIMSEISPKEIILNSHIDERVLAAQTLAAIQTFANYGN